MPGFFENQLTDGNSGHGLRPADATGPKTSKEPASFVWRGEALASDLTSPVAVELATPALQRPAIRMENLMGMLDSNVTLAVVDPFAGPDYSSLEWGINEGIGTGSLGEFGSCGGCSGCGNCGGSNQPGPRSFVNLDQVVFLDFDSGTDGNIVYTTAMRNTVQAQMEVIYEQFGVTFVQEAPSAGDYSTLVFNAGSQGGLAEDIDFRNLNKNDNAVLNVTGLGSNEAQTISASAVIGAHELGHILGLRHHDAWGPIGGGIPDNLFFPGYNPVFPGPTNADETRDHIMNTPALAGEFFDVLSPSWFGEREAIKLTFAANGSVVLEQTAPNDSFEQAQELTLEEITVPNTIVQGQNADAGDFLVDAVSVIGTFGFVDPADFYSFQGQTGLAYSFEVISQGTDRYSLTDSIDSAVTVFDSDFNPVDYYGTPAFNDRDVEFLGDVHLFDLILPDDGTYFVRVETESSGDTGTYELFINSFVASPFALPAEDDHSDLLQVSEATELSFEPVSRNEIARVDAIVGFQGMPTEQDVFTFKLDTSARVIVDVRSTSQFFNSFLELYDANGVLIGFNDDSGNPSLPNNKDSQLIVPDLAAGEYLVVASGANGSTGSYRLSVRHNGMVGGEDDHGNTFGTATMFSLDPLPATTFITARAELGNDIDSFRFTSIASGTMVVRSRALSGDLNTVLRGYDDDRNLLDANNNFNGSLDSRIALDVVAGESYFVRLSTVGETTGQYRLSFRTTSANGDSTGFELDHYGTNHVFDPNIDLNLNPFSCSTCSSCGNSSFDWDSLARIDNHDGVQGGILAG